MNAETKKAWIAFAVATISVSLGVTLGLTIYNDAVKRWVIKK